MYPSLIWVHTVYRPEYVRASGAIWKQELEFKVKNN